RQTFALRRTSEEVARRSGCPRIPVSSGASLGVACPNVTEWWTCHFATCAAGALRDEELPGLFQQLIERINREASVQEAGEIWTATYVLMGLRYTAEETESLMRGVQTMSESVTVQAILQRGREQGKLQEAVALLMKLGRKKLGAPEQKVINLIDGISDLS